MLGSLLCGSHFITLLVELVEWILSNAFSSFQAKRPQVRKTQVCQYGSGLKRENWTFKLEMIWNEQNHFISIQLRTNVDLTLLNVFMFNSLPDVSAGGLDPSYSSVWIPESQHKSDFLVSKLNSTGCSYLSFLLLRYPREHWEGTAEADDLFVLMRARWFVFVFIFAHLGAAICCHMSSNGLVLICKNIPNTLFYFQNTNYSMLDNIPIKNLYKTKHFYNIYNTAITPKNDKHHKRI